MKTTGTFIFSLLGLCKYISIRTAWVSTVNQIIMNIYWLHNTGKWPTKIHLMYFLQFDPRLLLYDRNWNHPSPVTAEALLSFLQFSTSRNFLPNVPNDLQVLSQQTHPICSPDMPIQAQTSLVKQPSYRNLYQREKGNVVG